MAKKPTAKKAATGGTNENDGTTEQTGGIRPRITEGSNADGSNEAVGDREPEDASDNQDTNENDEAREEAEGSNDQGDDDEGADYDDGDDQEDDNAKSASDNVAAMSANGDGVTNVTNDGDTYASRDAATGAGAGTATGDAVSPAPGTPDKDLANTQEGPTPMDKHGDTTDTDAPGTQGSDPTGPKSLVEASASAMQPAGTAFAAKAVKDVTTTVHDILGQFATKPKASPAPTANIHDDLGVARADVLALSDAIGKEFGIVIYASEGQNFLLVRDIINLVLRKLGKQS